MCCTSLKFFGVIYISAVYIFGLYLRFINFQDQFECYACKEMDFRKEHYDYIVVGSGSAGSIVARRLSDNKRLKILLLEAGSSGSGLLRIPATGLMLQNSVFDWQYRTVPQKKACLALDNKVSLWPMGKILGGTGMLNNMIYVRGHPDDFARWYKDKCNFNYTFDILPYYEKLENFGGNKHNCSIPISEPPYKSNISDYVLQAGSCLGFDILDGVNSEPGFSTVKLTMQNGQRWTSYHQLVNKKRKNVAIITNAFVEELLFHFDNKEVSGVKYTHLDEHFCAYASKGVILSAGVIGTPKILMLSGIGPKKHLQDLKIDVKLDLPVGDNLQDHVTTGLDLLTLNYSPNLGVSHMMSPWSMFSYFLKSGGPWTTAGCENIAFFNTDQQLAPELQLMIFPLGVTSDEGMFLRSLTGIGDKLWQNYFEKIKKPSFSILPVVLHPKSRGTVRLKSKDPKKPPLIDPKYLTDDYDVDILLQGIEMIKEFINTPAMRRLGVKINPLKFPGCERFDFDTKPYWECYVRRFTLTSYHPVGTCKLGDVVEDDFEVKGMKNLFVVDGSILPDLPSGNPNGAIMMMAERAADIIKHRCWAQQKKCCAEEVVKEQEECNC